jgi:hypothetical protein
MVLLAACCPSSLRSPEESCPPFSSTRPRAAGHCCGPLFLISNVRVQRCLARAPGPHRPLCTCRLAFPGLCLLTRPGHTRLRLRHVHQHIQSSVLAREARADVCSPFRKCCDLPCTVGLLPTNRLFARYAAVLRYVSGKEPGTPLPGNWQTAFPSHPIGSIMLPISWNGTLPRKLAQHPAHPMPKHFWEKEPMR